MQAGNNGYTCIACASQSEMLNRCILSGLYAEKDVQSIEGGRESLPPFVYALLLIHRFDFGNIDGMEISTRVVFVEICSIAELILGHLVAV